MEEIIKITEKDGQKAVNARELHEFLGNKLAIKEGFLEEKTRTSSKGTAKTFKAITPKGEAYGENQVSPNNPKETQPLWYEDKFEDLLAKLLGE